MSPLRKVGLHPLSAFAAICVDLMLFGPEAAAPPTIFITFLFGLLITLPVFLMQKLGSGDSAKIAFAKAMIIGILTAIPSPLPSLLTGVGGLLGLLGSAMSQDGKNDGDRKTADRRRDEGVDEDVIDVDVEDGDEDS